MRTLLAATCLTPFLLAAGAASAETVISTALTTPVATGTANDDLRITSTGSVKPTSGVAVTINSNDSVRNEGAIAITGANNAIGILASGGLTGNITNTGSITIDEDYTPTDTDSDGDIDGPFAQGSGRFGIRVQGPGAFTGTITNSGTINVEGNQSAGIAVEAGLSGALSIGGTVTVLGDNSFGLRAGDVSGNVSIAHGSVGVRGKDSVAVSLEGDIGGALVVQSVVSSTGYRNTTAPADTSKLDADDLLQGGSALVVAGDVAGGILLDTRPADNSTTDTDEDDDGIADAQEGNAAVTSFGSAPAFRIGSTTGNVAIGPVASSTDGHGLVIKGTVTGAGVYKTVSATGLAIGGTGHSVTIAGGMTVGGSVTATAIDANATGVRIGAGATVPVVKVTGTVGAAGGGTATTGAQALLIEAGANVTTIRNGGTIAANRVGTAGTAAAIVDKAGTVSLIENSGTIAVGSGTPLGDNGIAFDLQANNAGATVRQLVAATGAAAPQMSGNMLFGGGNDLLDILDGRVNGTARFGAGDNRLQLSGDAVMTGNVVFGVGADLVQLAGTSKLTGNIDFGGGADLLTLSGTAAYSGKLTNSAGTAVTVGAGSTLDVTNTGTVNLASLTTGAGSTIGVTIGEGAGNFTTFNIAGAASFGANTTIDVKLLNLGGVTGTYKIIQAGTLTGAGNLSSTAASLPFLFTSSLNTATAGEVSLVIGRKSATALGLNRSEASILDAVLDSADADAPIAAAFLGVDDSQSLRSMLQQMLPEHSGGAFENVTRGSRLTAGILADARAPIAESGGWGLWLQQVMWGTSKSIGSTSSYDLTGWGASAGLERQLGGAGHLGVSLAYLAGKDGGGSRDLMSSQYEGGIYWRGGTGPLRAFARAAAGMVDFDGSRTFSTGSGSSLVTRTAEGDWSGRVYSAVAGASYDARFGRFSLRPSATVEHYKLTEKGYTETGGGAAYDLTVRRRSSDETAAVGMLAIGYDLMSLEPNEPWLRVELEGGRREILSGKLGATTASFAGGQPFTLTPDERTSGWRAGLRVTGGGPSLGLAAEVNGEEQQGKASIGGRIGLRFAM